VYDMYPWDSASQGDYPPEPLRSRRNASTPRETSPAEAAQAVQVALDRRDNGGAAVPASQPAARQPAASQPAAQPAAPPTASLTRQ
jgi:hypothetical protein